MKNNSVVTEKMIKEWFPNNGITKQSINNNIPGFANSLTIKISKYAKGTNSNNKIVK